MENLTKRDISDVYSISCVERYVLAYLNKLGVSVPMLYCDSYISVDHLISDYAKELATYADYNAIPRIQDVANEMGILNIEGKRDSNLDFLDCDDSEYVLEMDQDAFKSMYEKETWRNDHFFYAKKNADGTYVFLNDIPLQEKIIDRKELSRIYHDRYIAFSYADKKIDVANVIYRFMDRYKKEGLYFNEANIDMEYEQLRDLICTLRISRKRVTDFIKQWKEPNTMWIDRVNAIFAKIEYSRVRKRYNSDIFFDEVDLFRQDETEIGKYLEEIKELIQKKGECG